MPRGRKRSEPVDTDIDGLDYTKDVVLGKDPAKHYAWIHQDDLGTCRGRGMVKTDRLEGGPSAPADVYSDGDIRVGDLVLMEMPKARHEAQQRANERRFGAMVRGENNAIKSHIKQHGGDFSVRPVS